MNGNGQSMKNNNTLPAAAGFLMSYKNYSLVNIDYLENN